MTTASKATSWDAKGMDLLAPLSEHQATVLVPFFANTLPLALHYTRLLHPAGKDSKGISRIIEWGRQLEFLKNPPSESAAPLVCYGSEKDYHHQKEIDPHDLDGVAVSAYKPIYLFAQMHLAVLKQVRHLSKQEGVDADQVPFTKVLSALLGDRNRHVELFSEIPMQAEALVRDHVQASRLVPVSPDDLATVMDRTHLQADCIRLFLWGGPMTWYCRRKSSHYIPLFVPESESRSEDFRTFVIVRTPDKSARAIILRAVEDYHRELFARAGVAAAPGASTNDCHDFRTMQYAYNRIARLRGHRSSFDSSKAYAECLWRHHMPPASTTTVIR